MKHSDCETGKAAIDLYFLGQDGDSFKATTFYEPYFYVLCKVNYISDSVSVFINTIYILIYIRCITIK